MRLAALNTHGVYVFGDHLAFNSWLKSPVPALNGESLLELLDTSFGFELADQILGKLEHSIYS